MHPNVLAVSFHIKVPKDSPWLRAYMPTTMCRTFPIDYHKEPIITGLGLVATRRIHQGTTGYTKGVCRVYIGHDRIHAGCM
jgi:hypothetical protein